MSRLLAYLLACSFACLFIFIDFLFVYHLSPWASPTAAVHKPRLFRRSVSSPYFPPRNRRRKKNILWTPLSSLICYNNWLHLLCSISGSVISLFSFPFFIRRELLIHYKEKENGGVILAISRARRRKKVNSVSLLVLEQEKDTCISSRLGRWCLWIHHLK